MPMRPSTEMKSALESFSIAERSAAIREHARDLGFHRVGIVRAAALLEESARLEEWLRRGLHGEMTYMARDPEQRTDPRKLFPDAHSVVVVALNYYTPHQHGVATTHVNRDEDISITGSGDEVSATRRGDEASITGGRG